MLLCHILYLHFKHQLYCNTHKLSTSSSGVDESNYLVQNPQSTKLSTRISCTQYHVLNIMYPTQLHCTCFGHFTWPLSGSYTKHIEKLIIPLCVYIPVPVAARRRFTAARLVRLRVRTPSGGVDVSCEFCMLYVVRALCDGLITRPEDSYPLWCHCV